MLYLVIAPVVIGLVHSVQAHGDNAHSAPPPVDPNADWATKHMAEEHHMASFDAGSFFNLHDYDSSNFWTADDLLKTYGLRHESTSHVAEEEKRASVQRVIDMFDRDKDNRISFAEYTIGVGQGLVLPDLGYGPGHHGDDEYEYEIHHWEKYHNENTKEEDLTHPEDIEHFRKHDEMEERELRQERMDKMAIIEANIPQKFRRKEL